MECILEKINKCEKTPLYLCLAMKFENKDDNYIFENRFKTMKKIKEEDIKANFVFLSHLYNFTCIKNENDSFKKKYNASECIWVDNIRAVEISHIAVFNLI